MPCGVTLQQCGSPHTGGELVCLLQAGPACCRLAPTASGPCVPPLVSCSLLWWRPSLQSLRAASCAGCYEFADGLMPYQWSRVRLAAGLLSFYHVDSCTGLTLDLPLQDTVGSMARTAEDLLLLDSIVRDSSAETTGNGAVMDPVSCAAPVNESISLAGLRLGLPSTFGWVTDGISSEVCACLVWRSSWLKLAQASSAVLL